MVRHSQDIVQRLQVGRDGIPWTPIPRWIRFPPPNSDDSRRFIFDEGDPTTMTRRIAQNDDAENERVDGPDNDDRVIDHSTNSDNAADENNVDDHDDDDEDDDDIPDLEEAAPDRMFV